VDRRRGLAKKHLQELAALALGSGAEVAVVEGEQIPGHVAGGRLGREQLDPRRRGVDAQQQRVEVQAARPGDHHLPVQDAAWWQCGAQRGREFGEVAVERLLVAALDEDLVAVAEDDGSKAVPLGLVLPARADRNLVGQLGQHRLDRRLKRQVHGATIAEAGRGADSLRTGAAACRRPRRSSRGRGLPASAIFPRPRPGAVSPQAPPHPRPSRGRFSPTRLEVVQS
jgi:hypothetical protein